MESIALIQAEFKWTNSLCLQIGIHVSLMSFLLGFDTYPPNLIPHIVPMVSLNKNILA